MMKMEAIPIGAMWRGLKPAYLVHLTGKESGSVMAACNSKGMRTFTRMIRCHYLKKEFRLSKKISSARLYISGLGYYEAYLNGKKVGDHVLDPGFTAYRKQVFYVTHDITALIKPGNNLVGIMLGNGWYNPLPLRLFGRFNLRDVQETGRPKVLAQMHLTYADG